MTLVFFLAGLVCLIGGAELLVQGSSRLAAAAGISPLLIGLTVVAFSTSSPELAVSIGSVLSGESSIAVGNVVGSNIFNVLLVLGLSAVIVPLAASRKLLRFDVPIMIAVSAVVYLFARDGVLLRRDGVLLFAGLLVYLGYSFYQGRKEQEEAPPRVADEFAVEYGSERLRKIMVPLNGLMVVVGLALLVLGARWFVSGAVGIARLLGMSELVIGLTVVAAGTSLPELATSITAAFKGEREIAVGNAVGSCIFNLMGVLGLAAAAAPHGIQIAGSLLVFDFPVMIVAAFACLPIFFTGAVISRGEGGLLLAYYAAYVGYLISAARGYAFLPEVQTAILYFVIPLTGVTLLVLALRERRRKRRRYG